MCGALRQSIFAAIDGCSFAHPSEMGGGNEPAGTPPEPEEKLDGRCESIWHSSYGEAMDSLT